MAERCPIARTLEVVSTKSAFLILREAFYGTTRFDDFAKRAQVSDPVTAARLSELVEEGLLEREPYQEPGQRTRHAYRLTEKGSDLLPTLVAMMQWGNRWLDDRGGRWSCGMLGVESMCGRRFGARWGTVSRPKSSNSSPLTVAEKYSPPRSAHPQRRRCLGSGRPVAGITSQIQYRCRAGGT